MKSSKSARERGAFFLQTALAHQTLTLIKVYYGALLALVNIYGLPQLGSVLKGKVFLPTWPIAWISEGAMPWAGAFIILGTMIVLALLSLWPLRQALRALAFVMVFFFNALYCSNGASTHLFQFWLWSCFMLALMPSVRNLDRRSDRRILIVGWMSAQGLVLMLYGLSGLWKTYGMIAQAWAGEPHFLASDGLSYHVASEILRTGQRAVLADYFLAGRWFSPLIAVGILLVQLGCFVVIFRPGLQRLWGAFLVLFHLGTYFVLNINYPTNIFLIAIMFLCSPFPRGSYGRSLPNLLGSCARSSRCPS